MILNIYCVKDNKVPCYTQLTTAASDGVAIRNAKTIIDNEQSSQFTRFSSDFDLYKLGTFDTETGSIVADFNFVMNFDTIKELA